MGRIIIETERLRAMKGRERARNTERQTDMETKIAMHESCQCYEFFILVMFPN